MRYLTPVYRPREDWRARFLADLKHQGVLDGELLCYDLREAPKDSPPHPCPWISTPQVAWLEWEPALWLDADRAANISHLVAYEAGGRVRDLESGETRDAICHQLFEATHLISKYGFQDGGLFPHWAGPTMLQHAALAIAECFEEHNLRIALSPGPGATAHNPFRVSAAAMRDPTAEGQWGEPVDLYEAERALLTPIRVPLWAIDKELFEDGWEMLSRQR